MQKYLKQKHFPHRFGVKEWGLCSWVVTFW